MKIPTTNGHNLLLYHCYQYFFNLKKKTIFTPGDNTHHKSSQYRFYIATKKYIYLFTDN